MRILEAQNATLTNVEVYHFLQKQAKEYQDQKRRGPGNLETLRREVSKYDIVLLCCWNDILLLQQIFC